MDQRTRTKVQKYAVVFLAWTIFGLFFFSQGLAQKYFSRDPTPWWHYLVSWLTGVYICAFLTPVVLWLGGRFPFERRKWIRRAALHFLFSLVFSVVEIAAHGIVLHSLGLFPAVMKSLAMTYAILVVIGFHSSVTTYWLILGVQYAFHYYQGYRERERQALRLELNASKLRTQLAHAQLSALKMQLHPHFLFNTMNAIMVLVRQQRGPQAEEMLGRLSDLLRLVLEDVDTQEVPLRRELEYLNLYLAIEQVRFADRLRVTISADPAILNAAVPHLGLQPIVENAIRHGIGRSSAAGNVDIAVVRKGDMLEVTIADDGPGFASPEAPETRGIGLANTRARLVQLYGEEAKLYTGNNPGRRGAFVILSIPYHPAPAHIDEKVMELHAFDDVAG